jgi:hypothetical protein
MSGPVLDTPVRGGHVHELVRSIPGLQLVLRVGRPGRTLIQKITKALDAKNVDLAMQGQRIRSLEAQVKALQPRKKKKVKLDPNERFARIEQIMAAKKELQKNVEPQANLEGIRFEDVCFEWSIFHTVDVGEV